MSYMPNTLDQITSSVPAFIAVSKNVCRTYREFDLYSEAEISDWTILAIRLQAEVNCSELQSVITELEMAIRSKKK